MQLQMKLTLLARAGVLFELLALLCVDSTVVAKQDRVQWPLHLQQASERVPRTPSSAAVLIERVNFVLDQDAQTQEEEAQNKLKAEQHRSAAAKTKSGPKAASTAAASSARPTGNQSHAPASSAAARTDHGVKSAASEASSSQGAASATPAARLAPASSAVTSSSAAGTAPVPASSPEGKQGASTGGNSVAALHPAGPGNAPRPGGDRPSRLTWEQLTALMPGATLRRTNTAGALRQWVNGADGTLTVYWGGGGLLQTHSASGKWSVTKDGHFCLQIDWPDMPENWCRFLDPTGNGAYQPVPDVADAGWTPPKDKTEWRPLTIRR